MSQDNNDKGKVSSSQLSITETIITQLEVEKEEIIVKKKDPTAKNLVLWLGWAGISLLGYVLYEVYGQTEAVTSAKECILSYYKQIEDYIPEYEMLCKQNCNFSFVGL